jgi:hypothetical protein
MNHIEPGELAIADLDILDRVSLRALENATLAIGRLDALGRSAEPGVQDVLALRCSLVAAGVPPTQRREGIIAILRADGEGGSAAERLAAICAEGATRSRAGVAPTARWVRAALGEGDDDTVPDLDARLRAMRPPHPAHPSYPGVLTALIASHAVGAAAADWADPAASAEPAGAGAVALAPVALAPVALAPVALSALVLHHAGSLGGTWCALPVSAFQTSPASDLVGLAESLATAAREAALALAAGTAAMQEHDDRVRAAYGRAAHGALAVLHAFRRWTVLEIPATARRLRITRPTVAAAIERLEALGLVTELTGRGRDRVWCYSALADAMLTVPK